jgi:hypothetical protein
VRDGLPPLCPRALTVWGTDVVREGMRDGITTGFECECMVVAGWASWTVGSETETDGVLVGIGFTAGLTVRREGECLAVRVPIFSDVLRGDEGEGCRYGYDLGEYIILVVGLDGVSP